MKNICILMKNIYLIQEYKAEYGGAWELTKEEQRLSLLRGLSSTRDYTWTHCREETWIVL